MFLITNCSQRKCIACNHPIEKDDIVLRNGEKWHEDACAVEYNVNAYGTLRFESWPSVTYAKV